jgi:hypothetical protein
MIPLEVDEDRQFAVRLGARWRHEVHTGRKHAFAGHVEVVNA